MRNLAPTLLLVALALPVRSQEPFPAFEAHVVSDDVPGAYCVRTADIAGDGGDVVSTGRMGEVIAGRV